MELIELFVALAALLVLIVAGFLFAFAFVVMPGIGSMGDRDFLKAFKAMDGVIQNNQPVFIVVWLGSALAVIAAAILSIWQLSGPDQLLVIIAALIYILGVQAPTVIFNIPLNNRLQAADLENLSEAELSGERKRFETPWLRWTWIRTVRATATSVILIATCLRM